MSGGLTGTRPLPIRAAISAMENQRISEVARLGIENPDVIRLWFGEPDLVTPAFIRNAATAALEEGHTFYVHRRGIRPLREEICRYLGRLYDLEVDVERVTVTGSGMTSIMIALQCLVDNGDNVVVVSPIWPNITYSIEAMGGECRHLRLDFGPEGWRLDLEKLAAAVDSRTKAIYVASPGNPSGWVMRREQQLELLAFARARGLWVIADEVYHRIVFSGEAPAASWLTITEPEDSLFVVQSFSKSWAMTGWRLGWLMHPPSLADRVGDLSAINNTGATSFVQHAGIAALREGEEFIAEVVAMCRAGRDLVAERLAAIGRVRFSPPDAAFYAFFAVEGIGDDLEFAKRLVREAGLGLAPGSAFGPGNKGFLRLCFATGEEKLERALDLLEQALVADSLQRP